MFGAGWTPTDAGLFVNLQPDDKFLLSVWIDDDGDGVEDAGEEYFVCHYNGYTGGKFSYGTGNFLKLIPQDAGATEPSGVSIWTVDTALTRPTGALGGVSYTMWSSSGYTLQTTGDAWSMLGNLSNNTSDGNLCDVVFCVPTVRASTNMDPNGTLNASHTALGRNKGTGTPWPTWAFDGKSGTGFLGMTYREVYWYDIPRTGGDPKCYANAALVTFNTTLTTQYWRTNRVAVEKGKAFYIYADVDKGHHLTPRTLFRLYILEEYPFVSVPQSYFFAWNEQDYVRYRKVTSKSNLTASDSTTYRKIYSIDHLTAMQREGSTKIYKTGGMQVPSPDSAYFYVGKNDAYRSSQAGVSLGPTAGAYSQFTTIKQLPVKPLADAGYSTFAAPAGAYGKMVVDTTSGADNLGVTFEPAGYFLRTSSGVNVRMHETAPGEWTSEQMWTIDSAWAAQSIKATLYTGSAFSASDPGADIAGWSEMVTGTSIKTTEGDGVVDKSGWARIYAGNNTKNGGIVFVLADAEKYIRYHNNGHFGVDIPDQHPSTEGEALTVQAPRLLNDYKFDGWYTASDGTGTKYSPGDKVDLDTIAGGVLQLYAKATYKGSINVAISFVKDDGKRYFMTHPGIAPRYAHSRHFDDWTNVWQGMADVTNADPAYINTYKIIGHPCVECKADEYVLDPHREMARGAEDSLLFYENFQPATEEYIGLYYSDPNTIIANTTWAGLFVSSKGWPTPTNPCIEDTKLSSNYYLTGWPDSTRTQRPNSSASNIKYNSSSDQFDGVSESGTDFMISGVGVVDAHYVILPDTTDASSVWTDSITFGYHEDTQTEEPVWSKLIGKQLMAQMTIGDEIIYFHPNRDKILTTANALRLSSDFSLTQTFTYIPDARGNASGVSEEDKASMRTTSNDFSRIITSGANSPMDVQAGGTYIDVCDTLRVRLTPRATSKIKNYYGIWKTGSPGLHVSANGSRYRDIIVKTKTYHYGPNRNRLILTPANESYVLSPLAGQSQTLDFKLAIQSYRELLDKDGNLIREDILSSRDTTTLLQLAKSDCSLQGATFSVSSESTVSDHVTIVTAANNSGAERHDTLTITKTILVGGVDYDVQARVPLMQSTMSGTELVWSAVDANTGKRYFITAGSGGLQFRQYTLRGTTLYKLNTWTKLKKGSANAANNDSSYITPWHFTDYGASANQQLTLKTKYDVSRHFHVSAGGAPETHASDSSILTYRYANVYVNTNANYEEQVRLKYGADQWLKFTVTDGVPSLSLQADSSSATVFSWGYLQQEYSLLNNGTYPEKPYLEFNYSRVAKTVRTRYKAYREYSMLLDNTLTYLGQEEEITMSNLIDAAKDWKTNYTDSIIPDARSFDGGAKTSGLSISSFNTGTLTSTVSAAGASPTDVTIGGKYVDIVDTLDFTPLLRTGAPAYRFKGDWSSFRSIADARVKIPLICKTYHSATYDSLMCIPAGDEYNYTFPADLGGTPQTHVFNLSTERRRGTQTLDVDNHVVQSTTTTKNDLTGLMALDNASYAEIRLIDEYGNVPSWCEISATTAHTITVRCKENGIRVPRTAYLYLAYIVTVDTKMRFINFRISVSQPSFFQYANNQILVHSKGASGDPLVNGMQQVHENKRILYYYNPSSTPGYDQNVELPIRERGFYGWWRWYREGKDEDGNDVGDTDVPDSLWQTPPRNVGAYNYPYRTIGDSVWKDAADHTKGKILVTMGRYTVFHTPAKPYSKQDPPAKSPLVYPPTIKDTFYYVADISNYYDNLPLSMKYVNQIDTAKLDTMGQIVEPTLSLREIFELHPWTEMAAKLEGYKDTIASGYRNQRYMEDHEVMAPIGNRLLLSTDQRYKYSNIKKGGHSESLLGYYMRDDNWSSWSADAAKQDTMIWCGGYDVDLAWYTYNPSTKTYDTCAYTITESDDFLNVPALAGIPAGKEADTVYYCLRSRSQTSTFDGTTPTTKDGDYWFNICRYTVIYHRPEKYGPKVETTAGGVTKALITNDEIEQNYEVLERLNFDYNKPGSDYTVYPHPLPWADASYGYSYPKTDELPDNRHHNDFAENFPNMGEYGLINKIPYSNYWYLMEQHGGAENGYMIYCDGMASAGQVAALTLNAQLCEGQKMYFSAYVGNPSSQKKKSNPNFVFSVQGSNDGNTWTDITSYMTGDIQPSTNWYQIYFPINQQGSFDYFRVRIYNMSSDIDGNDFILDDMCVFATKPPLIAYQANSQCIEEGESETLTNVVIRVDYQGFTDESFKGGNMYYTVEKITKDNDTSFVAMEDGYLNEGIRNRSVDPSKQDTIYGYIVMPPHDYEPLHDDSIFVNLRYLIDRYKATSGTGSLFRQGYIYENLDGIIRPVLYAIHKAEMTPANRYKVRMSAALDELTSSICAMTSDMTVSNRMTLELNGEERENKEITDACANATYDLSMRVKGTLFLDSVAPIDLTGTCMNDWLLYGDTSDVTSLVRYGYKYSDIVKTVKEILRCQATSGTNANQFASNLAAVSHNEMLRIQKAEGVEINSTSEPAPGSTYDPYVILTHLVNNGFLTMYQSTMTTTVNSGDSVQYVIMPILGSGSDELKEANVEVCPMPVFVKLKAKSGVTTPLKIGGLLRDETQANLPVVVLTDSVAALSAITIPIDSIAPLCALYAIDLLSTDDPNYREGVHILNLEPDRVYNMSAGSDNSGYYTDGDDVVLSPSKYNNYRMRPGYSYTYAITMQTRTGSLIQDGCPVGTVPFTVSVVPDKLRWDPATTTDNRWNNPENWIGINANNEPIHNNARFAPLSSSSVIIPAMTDGRPYPMLADPASLSSADSIKQTGFEYNKCDAIRFLAGAAMGQQQLLDYNNAVIDMRTPQDKWALRAAPVKGLLSGDIFLADADLSGESSPWEAAEFDARGRNYTTGNASFWLSMYSRAITQKGNADQVKDTVRSAAAEWTRAANGMTESLTPGMGWAVYTHTAADTDADVRLPKDDDIYYYYTAGGDKVYELYEHNLRDKRTEAAGGSNAGKLAYTASSYTLTNAVASTLFVFGNPTMAYIDIWGFISDNTGLSNEIDYIGSNGVYTTVNKATATAEAGTDEITNQERYLPPMHAMVVKVAAEATSKTVTLNANRVVTEPSQIVRPLAAPSRNAAGRSKGIMTVTAVNPVSPICTSRLLLGQGYHNDIRDGEDAVLTTVNIDRFSTATPSTPFNIYAAEGGYGLSIDLRDEVMNVPVSFYMSELPYDPTTLLWFTGVNAIDGSLVLYDALTGSERPIIDGICLAIATPEYSHQTRYFIRRRGYDPSDPQGNTTTAINNSTSDTSEQQTAVKIIRDGHVFILRDGHVFTLFGQKLQ